MLTLAISDVPCDDPAVIASGPTVPDPSTTCRGPGDRRPAQGARLPASAAALLDSPASETPKPGNPVFSATRVPHRRPPGRCDRGGGPGRDRGRTTSRSMLGADLEGEAREVAAAHAEMAKDAARVRPPGRHPLRRRAHRHDERPGPRRAEPGICAGARRRARRPSRASRRSPPTPTAPTAARGAADRPRRRDHRRHHASARAGRSGLDPGGVSRRERFDRFLRASRRSRHRDRPEPTSMTAASSLSAESPRRRRPGSRGTRLSGTHGVGARGWIPALRFAAAGMTALMASASATPAHADLRMCNTDDEPHRHRHRLPRRSRAG